VGWGRSFFVIVSNVYLMKFTLISRDRYRAYWECFTKKFPGEYTFLQSPLFGDFREKLGEKVMYVGVEDGEGDLVMANLVQVIQSGWKKWLHVPHMNVGSDKKAVKFFLEGLKNLGEDLKCDLVRISPLVEKNPPQPCLSGGGPPFHKGEAIGKVFEVLGFRDAAVHLVNPEKTWVLDITQSEEEILTGMDKKHRSDLKRGIKKGATIAQGNDKKNLDIFWDLHTETVKRQGFVPFSQKSTEIELEVFGKNVVIFNGSVEGQYFSSAIMLFDRDQAYYHQGASVSSKIPVSNVVLWEALCEAKKRGCKIFNFWGVSDKNNPKHPWSGLSRFKRKFGGREIDYLHCQDFPLTWKYYLNFCLEKWRRWRRGY
jgi:lipid II:glycine glycyltransferase (peptidoglycan interpeptide bridge formation enzyme)